MTIAELYEHRKNDSRWNTSYPLSPADWSPYRVNEPLSFENEENLSFYVHIPFCQQLCSFCEYTRMKCPDHELQRQYLETLANDLRNFKVANKKFTLYGFDIGGGTPTSLDEDNFHLLMDIYSEGMDGLNLSDDYEPSIEATFQTISQRKLELIAKRGFRRISFGVQSSNGKVLTTVNRSANAIGDMQLTIEQAHNFGIEKVNLDFMFGLSHQTIQSIEEDLNTIRLLCPEQVTLYELRPNMIMEKADTTPSQRYDFYQKLYNGLVGMGYNADFGQNTFSVSTEDRGLSSYLRHRTIDFMPYKGFGISAQSMNRIGIAYNIGKNHSQIRSFLEANSFVEEYTYHLPPNELASKYLAMSAYSGIFSLSKLSDILCQDSCERYKEQLHFCLSNNLLESKTDGLIGISECGFEHYGAVFSLWYQPYQTVLYQCQGREA